MKNMFCGTRPKRKKSKHLDDTSILIENNNVNFLENRNKCTKNLENMSSPLKKLRLTPVGQAVGLLGELQGSENVYEDIRELRSRGPDGDDSGSKTSSSSREESGPENEYDDDVQVKKSLRCRGQLKLSLSMNRGLLTVHVKEARNLQAKWKPIADCYIQVQLCSDQPEDTRCLTETVNNTNNPVFDEKFTFELMAQDHKKRLMMSAWHKDSDKKCSEFLGCMSFGVKHLVNKAKDKKVDGWYYLLADNFGHRKHLKVAGCTSSSNSEAETSKDIPEVCQTPKDTESFTLVIKKRYPGYGFTVRGSCPVKVCRVKENSTSHESGLQKGDAIIKINGQNVSRSTAESVASMVRRSEKQLIIDIQRKCRSEYTNSLNNAKFIELSKEFDSQDENLPPNGMCMGNGYDYCERSNQNVAREDMFHKQYQKDLILGQSSCGSSSSHVAKLDNKRVNCSSREQLRWNPDLSAISRAESMKSMFTYSEVHSTKTSVSHFDSVITEEHFPCPPHTSLISDFNDAHHITDDDSLFYKTSTAALPDMPNVSEFTLQETALGKIGMSRNNGDFSASDQSGQSDETQGSAHEQSVSVNPLEQNQTLPNEELQRVVQRIIEMEERFIKQMHRGIQLFSRPMRRCFTSSDQHAAIFQNIEKLVMISEYLIRQLLETTFHPESSYLETPSSAFVESIGEIYHPKMPMMCESYASYIRGLQDAFQVLDHVRENEKFMDFIQNVRVPHKHFTLEAFLRKPVAHFYSLVNNMQTLLDMTPVNYDDHEKLNDCVDALAHTCTTLPRHDLRGRSCSLGSRQSQSSTQSINSAHSVGSSVSSTVDSELVALQDRFSFPSHVQHFTIATSSRHVIFTGDLSLVNSSSATTIHVILLSDMLVLTQEQTDGTLVVLDDPLLLENVTSLDFSSAQGPAFTVTVETSSRYTSLGLKSYVLVAPSLEMKFAWKSILEQRVRVSRKEQPHIAICPRSEIAI